jgi:hypothetical protein
MLLAQSIIIRENKLGHTLGMFFSISGFSIRAIEELNTSAAPLLLAHLNGTELITVKFATTYL